MHLSVSDFVRKLLQRRDVIEDIDTATMGAYNDVVIARMDQDVVNANSRKTRHKLLPLCATIQRNEEAKLGTNVKQVLVFGILANNIDCAKRRKVVDD